MTSFWKKLPCQVMMILDFFISKPWVFQFLLKNSWVQKQHGTYLWCAFLWRSSLSYPSFGSNQFATCDLPCKVRLLPGIFQTNLLILWLKHVGFFRNGVGNSLLGKTSVPNAKGLTFGRLHLKPYDQLKRSKVLREHLGFAMLRSLRTKDPKKPRSGRVYFKFVGWTLPFSGNWVLVSKSSYTFQMQPFSTTPWKFNIAPENLPSQ